MHTYPEIHTHGDPQDVMYYLKCGLHRYNYMRYQVKIFVGFGPT